MPLDYRTSNLLEFASIMEVIICTHCSHKDLCASNSVSYITIPPSYPRLESKCTNNALTTIQIICFLPQNICSELPESRLDPRPTVQIPGYSPTGRGTTREKAGFATQEKTASTKEEVGSNITKGFWLHKRSNIWNGFCKWFSKVSWSMEYEEGTQTSSIALYWT